MEKQMDRLISADEVLRHIKHWEKGYGALKVGTTSFADGVIDGYARVKSLIERLPSYGTVRHGHWEDSSNGWMCSECFKETYRDYQYCPHCGAKMDGE